MEGTAVICILVKGANLNGVRAKAYIIEGQVRAVLNGSYIKPILDD